MAIKGFDTNYFVQALFDYAKEEYTEWAEGKTTADLEELLQNSYPDAADLDAAAEAFYADFGVAWGLAPNAYFDPAEYRLAWAEKQVETNNAFSVADALTAYDAAIASDAYNGDHYAHYLAKGAAMGVNPSNDFDESDYLQSLIDGLDADMTVAELRDLAFDAGITALDFFVDYPEFQTEYPAIAVTGDELVDAAGGQGTKFTLTEDVDKASANIFDAPRVWTPEGVQVNSLNDDDVLTGKGENPTLNFTFVNDDTRTADYNIMPEMTGIQTINVAFTADVNQTLDLQDATGVEVVNASRIDDGVVVNMVNIQEALTDISISNSNSPTSVVNITFVDKALRGTSDSLNLELSNAQLAALTIEEVAVADQGYETINLNSTGAANAVAVMAAEDVKSLIITGDESLTIGSLNEAGSLTTVDASALGSAEDSTAALDYTVDAGVMAAAPDGTSNGNVAFSLTATKNNDTVRISDQVGLNDTLAAGDGTDTIVMSNAGTMAFFANGTAQATGFEAASVVRLDDNLAAADMLTVDLDQISGDQTISLVNRATGDGNVTYNLDNATAAEAAAITIMHSGASETVNGDNGVGQNIIDLDVAAGVNTAGVAIAEGTNNLPKFNFTLTADSDAGTGEVDVAATNTVANVAITDNDSESNSVSLTEFAAHTGTITVTGGVASTFMNLDSTGNGFGIVQTGADGSAASAVVAAAIAANLPSPFGLDTAFAAKYAGTGYADVTGSGAGYVYDNAILAPERLVAATIDASAYVGDFIARVGEKNQDIKTGTGNDTIIFDVVGATDSSRLTAGLNISDKVAMNTGYDTIIIDGNVGATESIGLADTEWTNLTGVDAIRLGNAGAGTYRLTLSNSLVDQTDAGDRITIINSDGRLASAAGSAATINMRALNNSNFVDFYGANGSGVAESVNTIQVNEVTMSGSSVLNGGDNNVLQAYTAAAMNTLFPALGGTATTLDANLAWAVVNGQTTVAAALAAIAAANLVTPGSGAFTAAQFAALAPEGNNNVLEIYNSAEITVGDLANVSNFSTIEAINDLGVEQTINITLTDTIVDALVDASHASTTSQVEVLSFGAYDNLTNAGASMRVNLQAATLSAKSGIEILLGRGQDVVQTGAGSDVVVMAGNYIKGLYGVDATTGFDMNAVANWADDADDDNDGNVDVGLDGIAGTADDDVVMTQLAVTDTIALGTGNDTLITYGAIDLTGAAITGADALIMNSDVTMTAAQFAAFTSIKVEGNLAHTLTIVDNVAGANTVDLSKIVLNGGSLTLDTASKAATGTINDQVVSNYDKVTDNSTTGAVVIDTNVPPVAVADSFGTTPNNVPVTINVLANDSDANGNALGVVSIIDANIADGTAVINADNTITFTPAAGYVGAASFQYAVSDGLLTSIGTVTGTIEAATVTPGTAAYSATTFVEAAANNGSIATTSTLTLTGDTFVSAVGTDLGQYVTNVPAGLTASLVVASTTTATLSFTGSATAHENANDIANLTVALPTTAFAKGVVATGANVANLAVDFADAGTSTFTTVDLGSTAVTATAAAEAFVYDFQMVAGRATKAGDGEVTITGFDVATDKLVFNDVGTGTVYTEAQFMALAGVVIADNAFANNTTIYFDPSNGVLGGITLAGVVDAALANIVVETTA